MNSTGDETMNFSKHNKEEWEMSYNITSYCRRIFNYRKKKDDRYKNISTSTYAGETYIYHKESWNKSDKIMTIRYDERYGLYYFLEYIKYKNKRVVLENRIYIRSKKEFYSYFDYKMEEYFKTEMRKSEVVESPLIEKKDNIYVMRVEKKSGFKLTESDDSVQYIFIFPNKLREEVKKLRLKTFYTIKSDQDLAREHRLNETPLECALRLRGIFNRYNWHPDKPELIKMIDFLETVKADY